MTIHTITNGDSAYAVLKNFEGVYFDTVTNSSSIECDINNEHALVFRLGGYTDDQVDLDFLSIFNQSMSHGYYRMTEIIETSTGLIFMVKKNQDEDAPFYAFLVITKDDDDNTCIFYRPIGDNDPFNGTPMLNKFCLMDSLNPTKAEKDAPYDTSTTHMTTMVPMVAEGVAHYTPNLKFIVQRQFIANGGILLGGETYWTDGYIAVKD